MHIIKPIGKHYKITFLLLPLMGCSEQDPITPPDYDCRVHVSDSNIITDIIDAGTLLAFKLEDNSLLYHLSSCISDYSVDTGNWKVHLTYTDNSIQSLPFLGSGLHIDEDSIQYNPHKTAPLAALVNFTLPVAGRVKISVHSREEGSPTISHVFDEFKTHHSIPVLGLYENFENTVTLSVLNASGRIRICHQFKIKTDSIVKIHSGRMTVTTNNLTGEQRDRLYMVQNTVYDALGYIRWISYFGGQKYFPFYGNLIAIQLWGDKGDLPPVEEDIRIMDLMGREIATYDVPNRNHHEIAEKVPGGNLLVATNAQPYLSTRDDTEDAIVEIDRLTGEVVKFWDLREIFDPTRPRIWNEMVNDWCHLNSIEYDPSDSTLLISSKLQCFIAKIDYDSGDIRWIFGNHENWKEPWKEYLLTPLNFDKYHPEKDWCYAQHMPRLTGDGNVIFYDNGRNRPYGSFTRAHEFRVDTSNMTVEKVWTHDFTYSTHALGSIHKYEDGNVLIGHGERGTLIEVNPSGEVVFEAKLQTYYRAYPLQLY